MPIDQPIDSLRQRYENPEMREEVVSPFTAWALVVAVLLLITAVPVWRSLGGSIAGATLLDGWRSALAAEGVVDANRQLLAAMDRFETHLEEGSPVLGATLMHLQWFQLRFGGRGNESVYPGEDGWLLFRPGYDHLVGRAFLDSSALRDRRRQAPSWQPDLQPDPRPALLDFQRQLRERGADLVLLPVPTKPAIEPESLAPGAHRPLANPSSEQFTSEMEAAGIDVFDAARVLHALSRSGVSAYLRTDSHWSPAAVDTVAKELASWLLTTYGDELGTADASWQATTTRRVGRGDLWRLLQLSPERPLYEEETLATREITSWDGRLWSPSRSARVLVIGDSFVNVYSDKTLHWGDTAGLAEQLAFHLGRDVDRMARNDGATDQVRRDLARSPARLEGKRVVVYVFASRELSLGDWPIVSFDAGSRQ